MRAERGTLVALLLVFGTLTARLIRFICAMTGEKFMPFKLVGKGLYCFTIFLVLTCWGFASFAADLIVDGDFEATASGKILRRDDKGQDWYESRKDSDAGRALLKLSTKNIGGNHTRKAMIKADPELNTYLSQRFPEPQSIYLFVQYDIYIREILPDDNRSAFFFVGAIKDKKGGPNSTGRERFVFLGFENGGENGKINLFAREGESKWADKTIVARDLDLKKWYTISVEMNIPEGVYEVTVVGVTEGMELESLYYKGKTPDGLSHLSFASWNDGAGTFYVDNVVARN